MIHIRIAEHGKICSLQGDHKEALRHYREALRLVQNQEDSEIFSQHYSHCVMESLEQTGAYDEVIMFCQNYRSFLEDKTETDFTKKHRAFICERQGIQHLLKEEKEEALDLLSEAQKTIGIGKQPITDQLIQWIQRNYFISKEQIQTLQRKHNYFIVRKEKVNPTIAMKLTGEFSPL